MCLQFVVFFFAADRFPEVANLLRNLVAERPVFAWAFGFEELADIDSEYFLVLPNGPLVMNQDKWLPNSAAIVVCPALD